MKYNSIKTQCFIFIWHLVLAMSFVVSAQASSPNAKSLAYHSLTQELQINFRMIDLEDFNEAQFQQSIQKNTPLFIRLAWIDNRRVLEVVYAKQLEESKKEGLIVEINLPKGPWRSKSFDYQNVGQMISILLASIQKTLSEDFS